ncbi:MAG: hypothetical protein HOE69_06280 [Euryarchaeota archaeon]|nr:hypothetical protein [Euryarchaeota archaeon]
MSTKKFRLDVSGLLKLRILRIEDPLLEAEWISGGDYLDDLPSIGEINHLSIPIQTRILRLCKDLSSPKPSSGVWASRGILAAASQGAFGLSYALIDSWLKQHWSPIQEARARGVTAIFWQRLRNGVLNWREISAGVLDCSDMPAGLIPSIIRQRNWLRHGKEWVVVSGGNHIHAGYWLWYFDSNGIGTVLERNYPRNWLGDLPIEIGIHLNHPRVEVIDGHLRCAG